MLRLRLDGRPVSYILKCKEFYGLSFYVDERVLVPRPDTEVLVETALEILDADPDVVRIHDVCTGTGCVPIAIASCAQTNRTVEISASDISPQALEVFRLNCRKILGRELPHRESDLLDSAGGPFDMVTANPPYVTKEETARMMAAGWPEPALALDGGDDGLALIRRLIEGAGNFLRENGYLLVEGSDNQADAIRDILERRGWRELRTVRDLAGRRRVSVGRRGTECSR
jgi:release factor glutamine methyltransferase